MASPALSPTVSCNRCGHPAGAAGRGGRRSPVAPRFTRRVLEAKSANLPLSGKKDAALATLAKEE